MMTNNIMSLLPDEIIKIILQKTNIRCHICYCNYNINFYKKQNNYYYCTKDCYEFT